MKYWMVAGVILGVAVLISVCAIRLSVNPRGVGTPTSENQVAGGVTVPVWSPGDNWTLRFTYPQENDRTLVFYHSIVGENLIDNRWCYEMRVWTENQKDLVWNYYGTENLLLVGSQVEYASPRYLENIGTVTGGLNLSRSGSDYDFPLVVGKSWSYSPEMKTIFYLDNGDNLEGGWVELPTQYSCRVENVENVEVEAGTFESYLIHVDIMTTSGIITKLNWFSEETGWLVKEERYIGENKILEVELIDFSHGN